MYIDPKYLIYKPNEARPFTSKLPFSWYVESRCPQFKIGGTEFVLSFHAVDRKRQRGIPLELIKCVLTHACYFDKHTGEANAYYAAFKPMENPPLTDDGEKSKGLMVHILRTKDGVIIKTAYWVAESTGKGRFCLAQPKTRW